MVISITLKIVGNGQASTAFFLEHFVKNSFKTNYFRKGIVLVSFDDANIKSIVLLLQQWEQRWKAHSKMLVKWRGLCRHYKKGLHCLFFVIIMTIFSQRDVLSHSPKQCRPVPGLHGLAQLPLCGHGHKVQELNQQNEKNLQYQLRHSRSGSRASWMISIRSHSGTKPLDILTMAKLNGMVQMRTQSRESRLIRLIPFIM